MNITSAIMALTGITVNTAELITNSFERFHASDYKGIIIWVSEEIPQIMQENSTICLLLKRAGSYSKQHLGRGKINFFSLHNEKICH